MRKIIVAGNWKMNNNLEEAKELFGSIVADAGHSKNLEKVLVFPPYPYLLPLKDMNSKDFIHLGSQNIADENKGAYTGEVSAGMIKSLGINYTLIGHSERRLYYGENGDILKKKIDMALSAGLTPVFCCGESLEERKKNIQEDVIEHQMEDALGHLDDEGMKKIIIAYEPVWAIGTGETATSEQAESMHAFIRSVIHANYGESIAENMHILYGGSCNAGNAKELFSCENVDGGLIGGASLKADEFLKIISLLDE